MMPELTASAHLDAIDLGRSAGQPRATAAAARNSSPPARWFDLGSTPHRNSDKMNREFSRWVIRCACRYSCAAYFLPSTHLVKWRR